MAKITNRELFYRLASAYGVATEFHNFAGEVQQVADDTIIAVLESMGVCELSDASLATELERISFADWETVLPPTTVLRQDMAGEIKVHVPHGQKVRVELRLEDARVISLTQVEDLTFPKEIQGRLVGQAAFAVPYDLPLGYHTLIAYVGNAEPAVYESMLIVVPISLTPPSPNQHSYGLMAQLYSVRSRQSWGIGDFADLTEMSAIFGEFGADFLLVNPLHAAEPVGEMSPSPYLPVTRAFFNPIYIRPENIQEFAYLPASQNSLLAWAGAEIKSSSTRNALIDRDAVWEVKKSVLEAIFQAPRSVSREQSFTRFCVEKGSELEDFALWCALIENDSGQMSAKLPPIDSPQIKLARIKLAERIKFWMWLQWVADEQLAQAQKTARDSGMKYGICHDLAVGVHPAGADIWRNTSAFAKGMTVGAPPDMYNQQGQNWSQPPWSPRGLVQLQYKPLREMLAAVLRHAGALRIDHIMGLFRLWWIPEGKTADCGTYVRFDHDAMVGIVLLEALRADAILVGEDLGTVEPWVREYLKARGILGTSVFWFEKEADGSPMRPEHYRHDALVTVDTHDLPPIAGYLAQEHIDLRAKLKLLVESEQSLRKAADEEYKQVVTVLQEQNLIPEIPTERELIEALHLYIARTPAPLLGISLVDAVGERRIQNQPGTYKEYPNWQIPLADGTENVVLVEELPAHPRLRSLMHLMQTELASD